MKEGKRPMSSFTPQEIAYLQSQLLGRLATVGIDGDPHVVPVGFRYNPDFDTIDIGGRRIAQSKKFRDVARSGRAAFVVDDLVSTDPWTPRMLTVRGRAEALPTGGQEIQSFFAPELIRIMPMWIGSFGINAGGVTMDSRKIG
jgi:pyridoxamine 5'-phosphate oxidase family protein